MKFNLGRVLFEYETQKLVQINSKGIGATFRLIQVGIIIYVVVWVMIYEKGYQSFDTAISGVTAKLKGVAFANLTDNPNIGAHLWDVAEYVTPPSQNGAFFVMTNVVITPGQTQTSCDESHDVFGNGCKTNNDCKAGTLVMLGSGVQTGKCVPSIQKNNTSVCEIYGWCPSEFDVLPKDFILSSAPNFTVLIKNSIEFPRYNVKRRNILKWMDKNYLYNCHFDPHDEKMKFCPIFRLADIMEYSEAKNKNIWREGGMVSIKIKWQCDLDYDEDYCIPNYSFRRLDDFDSPIAKGWNFRYAYHYRENGVDKRTLIKAYGIQFYITVYGNGGKFNILTFSMNMGSGLALLGLATVICDMIVLNVTHKRRMYRDAKVDFVTKSKAINKIRQMSLYPIINDKVRTVDGSERMKIHQNIDNETDNVAEADS